MNLMPGACTEAYEEPSRGKAKTIDGMIELLHLSKIYSILFVGKSSTVVNYSGGRSEKL